MPRKKKAPEFADEQEEQEDLEWDYKKIIVAGVVLLLLISGGIFAKKFILGNSASSPTQSVQGISMQANESLPTVQSVQQGVQTQIANLQTQASQISVQEIASSSPQVQQILQQLKQLPNTPGNMIKQTCQQICSGL